MNQEDVKGCVLPKNERNECRGSLSRHGPIDYRALGMRVQCEDARAAFAVGWTSCGLQRWQSIASSRPFASG